MALLLAKVIKVGKSYCNYILNQNVVDYICHMGSHKIKDANHKTFLVSALTAILLPRMCPNQHM